MWSNLKTLFMSLSSSHLILCQTICITYQISSLELSSMLHSSIKKSSSTRFRFQKLSTLTSWYHECWALLLFGSMFRLSTSPLLDGRLCMELQWFLPSEHVYVSFGWYRTVRPKFSVLLGYLLVILGLERLGFSWGVFHIYLLLLPGCQLYSLRYMRRKLREFTTLFSLGISHLYLVCLLLSIFQSCVHFIYYIEGF